MDRRTTVGSEMFQRGLSVTHHEDHTLEPSNQMFEPGDQIKQVFEVMQKWTSRMLFDQSLGGSHGRA